MTNLNLLSREACVERIVSIRESARGLQDSIHIVAVSTLAHIRDHGDWTVAASLLNALPSGQRVQTLAKWFNHFSGKQINFFQDKKAGNVFTGKLVDGWKADKFDVDSAMATQFGDLEAEKVNSVITLDKLRHMIARVANNTGSNKDGSRKVSDVTMAAASKCVALLDELKAAQSAAQA
jgi:hypothetical protein